MIFFIDFIYAFLPLAVFYAMLRNTQQYERVNVKTNTTLFILITSIFVGIIAQRIAISSLYEKESLALIKIFCLVSWLIFGVFFIFKPYKWLFYMVIVFTSMDVGATYINTIKNFSLSTTSVINTELIVHISYILLAIVLVSFLAVAIGVLSKHIKENKFYRLSFILALALFLVQRFANLMLYGFKKDFIDLTPMRLSFVAKVAYYDFIVIYLYLGLISLFSFLYYLHVKNKKIDVSIAKIQMRKVLYKKIVAKRWLNSSLIAIFLVVIHLFYYDLYASRPPQISTPIMLVPDKNNQFVIELKDVMDGDLHRYGYITDDGHKVRFFLINRYSDREKVTAVFDACMICGDMGYIKQDNQVICVACGVRIFIPSIGKSGGCNPIPFAFEKHDGKLFINLNEIISGAKYFSEIVDIEVKDPISGVKMINTDASFSYEYLGKTFYFENSQNQDTFRDNPEKYVKNFIKRKWRVEGHDMSTKEEK